MLTVKPEIFGRPLFRDLSKITDREYSNSNLLQNLLRNCPLLLCLYLIVSWAPYNVTIQKPITSSRSKLIFMINL